MSRFDMVRSVSNAKDRVENLYSARETGRWALLDALLEAWAIGAKPDAVARIADRIVALERQRDQREVVVVDLHARLMQCLERRRPAR